MPPTQIFEISWMQTKIKLIKFTNNSNSESSTKIQEFECKSIVHNLQANRCKRWYISLSSPYCIVYRKVTTFIEWIQIKVESTNVSIAHHNDPSEDIKAFYEQSIKNNYTAVVRNYLVYLA